MDDLLSAENSINNNLLVIGISSLSNKLSSQETDAFGHGLHCIWDSSHYNELVLEWLLLLRSSFIEIPDLLGEMRRTLSPETAAGASSDELEVLSVLASSILTQPGESTGSFIRISQIIPSTISEEFNVILCDNPPVENPALCKDDLFTQIAVNFSRNFLHRLRNRSRVFPTVI